MKPYLLTTGILFTAIVVAHIARIVAEWPPSLNPETVIVYFLTLLCAALAAWAFYLFTRHKS